MERPGVVVGPGRQDEVPPALVRITPRVYKKVTSNACVASLISQMAEQHVSRVSLSVAAVPFSVFSLKIN
jgi:hypothetical protein